MREPRRGAADPVAQLSALAERRVTEYVDLWEHAVSRLANSEYHSEDLLDDWFSWWGKWVRDSTAATAWLWRAYTDEAAAAGGKIEMDDR
jgi:hypothetical protein